MTPEQKRHIASAMMAIGAVLALTTGLLFFVTALFVENLSLAFTGSVALLGGALLLRVAMWKYQRDQIKRDDT